MQRAFVSDFLLPLVKGGSLRIGRPLDEAAVARLWAVHASADPERSLRLAPADLHAVSELGFLRARTARTLLLDAQPPPLDQESLRLAAALHDVLLLSHPDLGDDPADRTRQRIADVAHGLAAIGPPRSAHEAVRRQSLLFRLSEIVQTERVVTHWLGHHRFVGRTPPARLFALPRLRRVRLEETHRGWLREIGISTVARPAWKALLTASPLAEALDPLRLEPPLSFPRILPILRFAGLARVVACRLLDIGLVPAGSAYAAAIFRYAALRESADPKGAPRRAVALGISFLAHLCWLDLLLAPAGQAETESDGGELGELLVAAAATDPRLVHPPDISPLSDAGQRMRRRLASWHAAAMARGDARHRMALGVAAHAARVFEERPLRQAVISVEDRRAGLPVRDP